MLDDSTPPSWYVMERLALPYDVATSALGSIVPVNAVESAMGGRLEVDHVQHARPGAVEGLVGRLHCGRLPWQIVSVELMVEPWSHRESVVALRPNRRPPRVGADRYFGSAVAVLDTLRTELVATAAAESARALACGPDVPGLDMDELPKAS